MRGCLAPVGRTAGRITVDGRRERIVGLQTTVSCTPRRSQRMLSRQTCLEAAWVAPSVHVGCTTASLPGRSVLSCTVPSVYAADLASLGLLWWAQWTVECQLRRSICVQSPVATIGIFVQSGSINENPYTAGGSRSPSSALDTGHTGYAGFQSGLRAEPPTSLDADIHAPKSGSTTRMQHCSCCQWHHPVASGTIHTVSDHRIHCGWPLCVCRVTNTWSLSCAGYTHLLEAMAFKGTNSRSYFATVRQVCAIPPWLLLQQSFKPGFSDTVSVTLSPYACAGSQCLSASLHFAVPKELHYRYQ